MEASSGDPLIQTTYGQQPLLLRAPQVLPEPAGEPTQAKAFITMKVWHLALVSVLFVLTVWHFELGLI
jgi:hypothetical protein